MTPTTATATAVRTFAIDPTHSEVGFQVRHLLTRVRGRFTKFGGAIQFDEAHPEQSSLTVSIDTASIDTGTPDRDAHLRSGDFFDVEKYPAITFASARITRRSGEQFDVEGTLAIRDKAQAITLPVAYLGKAVDPWGNQRLGFETEITINRKDFGLNWNAALETGGFLVGDEVKIAVSLQAVGQYQSIVDSRRSKVARRARAQRPTRARSY
jgi:polyisoprenoid-binding protein YceI